MDLQMGIHARNISRMMLLESMIINKNIISTFQANHALDSASSTMTLATIASSTAKFASTISKLVIRCRMVRILIRNES